MNREGGPDYLILFAVLGLLGLGIVMVYSSSSVKAHILFGDGLYYLKRQAAWAALGLIAMRIAQKFDYRNWDRMAVPVFYGSLLLLIAVLIPGIGQVAHGSRRWLEFGFMRLNPSEVMKLSLVLFLARYCARRGPAMRELRSLRAPLILMGITFGLILLQPDLGTAAAIAAAGGIMLFVGGARLSHLFALVVAVVPAMAWMILGEEYRRKRFFAFLDPWADPQGSGYHIIQALYALGSGGLFGLGLGGSRQKFFYLPEQHTDFIFAIIGEELGFLGTLFVIALFFLLGWRGLVTALRAPCAFSGLIAAGITMMIVFQAIINIGVISSVLPITGIPLPLVSYGGSSLLFTLAAVGILLNISQQTT